MGFGIWEWDGNGIWEWDLGMGWDLGLGWDYDKWDGMGWNGMGFNMGGKYTYFLHVLKNLAHKVSPFVKW